MPALPGWAADEAADTEPEAGLLLTVVGLLSGAALGLGGGGLNLELSCTTPALGLAGCTLPLLVPCTARHRASTAAGLDSL